MCGRFSLSARPRAVAELLDLPAVPELFPRYNVAPTQTVATAVADDAGRMLSLMRWGITPSWAAKMLLLNSRDFPHQNALNRNAFRDKLKDTLEELAHLPKRKSDGMN